MKQELDAVVRLDVVLTVGEHLEQRVHDSPRGALVHVRQQLSCNSQAHTLLELREQTI